MNGLNENTRRKTKVLIVDDSAVVRQTLKSVLESDREIEVIGTASDPFAAAQKMRIEAPDVITLDIEMPRMDGLTFLKKIMQQHPIPVVIVSSLAGNATESGLKALELGAVEIITKPRVDTKSFLAESKIRICDAVKAASLVKKTKKEKIAPVRVLSHVVEPKLSADAVMLKASNRAMTETTEKVVSIGASTGGTEALKSLLMALPGDSPGIVIVQHMPEVFTQTFAKRLNDLCEITVKEAEDNDTVIRGRALIAPGNKHMVLKRSGARYYVSIKDGPLVNRHRPSVDVLFRSTATYAGKNAIGIIMTGMGDDGARGLLEMRESGALTVAQDESSCVVFGMPREAIKLNAASRVLGLTQMPSFIVSNTK